MKKYYVIWCYAAQKGVSGIKKENYDLSTSCPTCGTGAKLAGNLVVSGISNVKKDIFVTYTLDILISEKLYHAIQEKIPAFRLVKTVNLNGEEHPYYHLFSEFNFPKMNKESVGTYKEKKQSSCHQCQRDGYYNSIIMYKDDRATEIVAKKYTYNYEELEHLDKSEVFTTWEGFGTTMESRGVFGLARPQIIISDTIKEVFESLKIRNMVYEELIIKNMPL